MPQDHKSLYIIKKSVYMWADETVSKHEKWKKKPHSKLNMRGWKSYFIRTIQTKNNELKWKLQWQTSPNDSIADCIGTSSKL